MQGGVTGATTWCPIGLTVQYYWLYAGGRRGLHTMVLPSFLSFFLLLIRSFVRLYEPPQPSFGNHLPRLYTLYAIRCTVGSD